MIHYKKVFTAVTIIILLSNLKVIEANNDSNAVEINVQKLTMEIPPNKVIFKEALLKGEIAETDVNHFILLGPYLLVESSSKVKDVILLFIKGTGKLEASNQIFNIEPESIAIPPSSNIVINVAEGDTLHFLKIVKKLSAKDLEDLKEFPAENRDKIYFKKYKECEAYTEKIKSPNTVSRTVLPKDHVPRTAMGTVETIGPDAVGAHEHPMLDQLFLGLEGNDVTVHADDKSVHFAEFSILHIPIGSNHWVTVDEGKKMYYQWMDFFLTKEGEEWLKTHKQVDDYKKK